jgi:RNA polymerase sigma-70 factor, ECF subfamily
MDHSLARKGTAAVSPPDHLPRLQPELSEVDRESFLQNLLEEYWKPLVSYAGRFVDTRDDAEDVVQEVFVRLWTRNQTVKDPTTVRAWLYTLVHHIAVDERRKRAVRARWRDAVPVDDASARTPLQLVEDAQIGELIDDAIQQLPERRREVFVLAHLHGLTYREVSEVLGISPQTVANQVSSALAELRRALASTV